MIITVSIVHSYIFLPDQNFSLLCSVVSSTLAEICIALTTIQVRMATVSVSSTPSCVCVCTFFCIQPTTNFSSPPFYC